MSNKRYFWLKLKDDFFEQDEIKIVEQMDNGKDYVIFYMKLILKSINTNGELRFKKTIPYSEKMLATITNVNVDIVRSAIAVFIELGMMEKWDDGTLFMRETQDMIGSETGSAQRMRRSREAKSIENKPKLKEVSHCDGVVTNSDTEIDTDKEKEIEKEKEIDLDSDEEVDIKKPENKNSKQSIINRLQENGIEKDLAEEIWDYRKNIKKDQLTDRALSAIINHCHDNNFNLSQALILMMENSWKGFKVQWVSNQSNVQQRGNLPQSKADQVSAHNDAVLEKWLKDRGLENV